MPLPRFRLRTLMIAVAVAALGLIVADYWLHRRFREPQWDPSGPLMSIDPPEATGYPDPYNPD